LVCRALALFRGLFDILRKPLLAMVHGRRPRVDLRASFLSGCTTYQPWAPGAGRQGFLGLTMIIAVPEGVKVFKLAVRVRRPHPFTFPICGRRVHGDIRDRRAMTGCSMDVPHPTPVEMNNAFLIRAFPKFYRWHGVRLAGGYNLVPEGFVFKLDERWGQRIVMVDGDRLLSRFQPLYALRPHAANRRMQHYDVASGNRDGGRAVASSSSCGNRSQGYPNSWAIRDPRERLTVSAGPMDGRRWNGRPLSRPPAGISRCFRRSRTSTLVGARSSARRTQQGQPLERPQFEPIRGAERIARRASHRFSKALRLR